MITVAPTGTRGLNVLGDLAALECWPHVASAADDYYKATLNGNGNANGNAFMDHGDTPCTGAVSMESCSMRMHHGTASDSP